MSELLTTTLADKKRACELGAQFIEDDLRALRTRVRDGEWNEGDGAPRERAVPASTSHENDVMKAMEWASAATWLRAIAEAS